MSALSLGEAPLISLVHSVLEPQTPPSACPRHPPTTCCHEPCTARLRELCRPTAERQLRAAARKRRPAPAGELRSRCSACRAERGLLQRLIGRVRGMKPFSKHPPLATPPLPCYPCPAAGRHHAAACSRSAPWAPRRRRPRRRRRPPSRRKRQKTGRVRACAAGLWWPAAAVVHPAANILCIANRQSPRSHLLPRSCRRWRRAPAAHRAQPLPRAAARLHVPPRGRGQLAAVREGGAAEAVPGKAGRCSSSSARPAIAAECPPPLTPPSSPRTCAPSCPAAPCAWTCWRRRTCSTTTTPACAACRRSE